MINVDQVDFEKTMLEIILKNKIKVLVCKFDKKYSVSKHEQDTVIYNEKLNKMELIEFFRELDGIKQINFIDR